MMSSHKNISNTSLMAVTYSVNFSLNSEYPMTSRRHEKGSLCSEYCEHDIVIEDETFFVAFLEVRISNVKMFFVCKIGCITILQVLAA